MDNTVLAVVITAIPSTCAGIAAIITAVSNKKISLDSLTKKVDGINSKVDRCREDISVTKEASFYALQAHVENGVNGDVKKAHQRLRENVFWG